ncbi:MAG: hypothetical protein LBV17_10630, partial [Treponema sp.]|nr:hypothetical protein [Treponema sp.]
MKLLYKSGFLFTPNVENTKWTEYFYSSNKLSSPQTGRMDKGICYHVAEYFHSNLNQGGKLQSLYHNVPWIETITGFSERCFTVSREFISKWDIIHPANTGVLGHGESCIVTLPGYVYVSNGTEAYDNIIQKFYYESILIRKSNSNRDKIKELVGKIFLLRYGVEPEGYNKPAEYFQPSAFFSFSNDIID